MAKIKRTKDKQYNGQNKKDKGINNDIQSTTPTTKDRATRTPLKTRGDLDCSGRVSSFCSICDTLRVTLVSNPVYKSHE